MHPIHNSVQAPPFSQCEASEHFPWNNFASVMEQKGLQYQIKHQLWTLWSTLNWFQSHISRVLGSEHVLSACGIPQRSALTFLSSFYVWLC